MRRSVPTKRPRELAPLPDDLGTLLERDTKLFAELGWSGFIRGRQARGDLSALSRLRHPARRLLRQYKFRGAPVVLHTAPWTPEQCDASMERGPHKSSYEHIEFLRAEFAEMVNKAQWVLLPYDAVRHLPGLRISPMGVVPQHERRPRTIVDYTFHGVNDETVRLAPMEAMQFGQALQRILRDIVVSDPANGPVKLIKIDVADGFYRIGVKCEDVPKLGVAFPSEPGQPQLVAFPITLPMGWTNSPPIFCAATETIADIANHNLLKWRNPPLHRLEDFAATPPPPPDSPPAAAPPATCEDPPTRCSDSPHAAPPVWVPTLPLPLPTPTDRDPALHLLRRRPTATVDVFVDDFIGVAQGSPDRLRRVRRILLDAIDQVFRPPDAEDSPFRREPSSVKKMLQGDASWSTCKVVLGWLIDTTAMTISLPPRRLLRLAEILNDIPLTQKRISVKRWHRILGELRSMAIAIPGARGLFSHMQEALRHRDPRHHLNLRKGVHDALQDFRLLHDDLERRPTRLYELVPLPSTLAGAHDASGKGAGGVWLPSDSAVPRQPPLPDPASNAAGGATNAPAPARPVVDPASNAAGGATNALAPARPVVWRAEFPPDIVAQLSSFENPSGAVTNSDLELAGGLLHHEAAVQCFDVRERTVLSKTDNTPALFWQRKGSTTTTGPAAYLLRAQALHQRHHRYLARHDFLEGYRNVMADDASRLHELSDADFLSHFAAAYPQSEPWLLWTPSPAILSAVTSSLRRMPSEPASLLNAPPPPMPTGTSGRSFATPLPLIPSCPPSPTPLPSSKSSPSATVLVPLPPVVDRYGLEPWKMPYGALGKRSPVWGPPTHA